MARNLTIASRLREVLLDGHWISNSNYKEQILSVNWQQATQKVGSLNTIATTSKIPDPLAVIVKALQ